MLDHHEEANSCTEMIHNTEHRAGYRPFESVRVIRLARFQCSGKDVNESGKLIDRPGYRQQTLIDNRIKLIWACSIADSRVGSFRDTRQNRAPI
jgi:hypothetical protein